MKLDKTGKSNYSLHPGPLPGEARVYIISSPIRGDD
jgi:hypothetical protein